MNFQRFLLRAAACVFTATLSSSALAAKPVASARRADYVQFLRRHTVWTSFPIRVYFAHDACFTEQRQAWAKEGFKLWSAETDGQISFVQTASAAEANVKVTFRPDSDDGLTVTGFRGGRLRHAEVTIGVAHGGEGDLVAIAAHEFGHALGIDGHSDERGDLMYPFHTMGDRARITARDMQTLLWLYPGLEQRSAVDAQVGPVAIGD